MLRNKNNMIISGNYGDTAKDIKKNNSSPLAYRVILISNRLNKIEKMINSREVTGVSTIGGIPPAAGTDYTDAQIAALPSIIAKEDSANKGIANGYASLDGIGKVPLSQIPTSLIGAVSYQGTWNANTDTPALPAPGAGNKGWYYVVSVAGNYGGVDYYIGDWVVSDGISWQRVDGNTEAFIQLTDTPSSYAGQALRALRVNAGETKLEYTDLFSEVEAGNTIYVSKNGNDANDGLTSNRPKLTISNAISIANPLDIIIVENGVYTENLTIDKEIVIKGACALKTTLEGKITFNPSANITAVVSMIGIENTNDFCVDCQPTVDLAALKFVNVRMEATWTSGPGQTTETAKACVKLSRGTFINRGSSKASIIASDDDEYEHNTCIYWVTGSNRIFLESFGIIHSITNSSDTQQNIEIMFNNNSSSNGIIIIKNGFCQLTGVNNASNYIAPFYMYKSNNTAYIDGNILFMNNSEHSYATFHYKQSATSIFSNNTLIHSNIEPSEIYIGVTFSTTGRIKIVNNFYDVDFIPKVSGNVEYFYTNNAGDTYHSKGLTGRVFTPNVFPVTIANNDGIHTVLVATGAADRTVNLPTTGDNVNRVIHVKKIDSGAGKVIIDPPGVSTIDGLPTQTIAGQWTSIKVQSDGGNWFIL